MQVTIISSIVIKHFKKGYFTEIYNFQKKVSIFEDRFKNRSFYPINQ